jgi:hypothetical protein
MIFAVKSLNDTAFLDAKRREKGFRERLTFLRQQIADLANSIKNDIANGIDNSN